MNCIYHKGTILAVILLSVTAISCGILEDRDECPCVITFKAIDLPSYECKPVIYIYDSGQMKERIEVPAGMFAALQIKNPASVPNAGLNPCIRTKPHAVPIDYRTESSVSSSG